MARIAWEVIAMSAQLEALLAQARDAFTVKRVFGDPIQQDGVTLIPVATLRAGGGGGSGEGPEGQGKGFGGGLGLTAKGLGMYVVKGEDVRFVPTVDVNRVLLISAFVAVVALCAVGRPLAKASAKKR